MDKNKAIINELLEQVKDPEIPVLSIFDMGIVKEILIENNINSTDKFIRITITPTYNGCPAMDMIKENIISILSQNGYRDVEIKTSIYPPWTTNDMTETGKQKLKEYGIAPPEKRFSIAQDGVVCPRCNSTNTKLISEFGSTACKAFFQCNDCKEPFDYFKCH